MHISFNIWFYTWSAYEHDCKREMHMFIIQDKKNSSRAINVIQNVVCTFIIPTLNNLNLMFFVLLYRNLNVLHEELSTWDSDQSMSNNVSTLPTLPSSSSSPTSSLPGCHDLDLTDGQTKLCLLFYVSKDYIYFIKRSWNGSESKMLVNFHQTSTQSLDLPQCWWKLTWREF